MPRTQGPLFGLGHKLLPAHPLEHQSLWAGRRAPWRRGYSCGIRAEAGSVDRRKILATQPKNLGKRVIVYGLDQRLNEQA